MTDETSSESPLPAPPVTGHHDIDRALRTLAAQEPGGDPVAAIAHALETVQQALSGPSVPAALRPRP